MAGAGGEPPTPLAGEADMIPQRARGGRIFQPTLSGATGSTNDSGMSDTSGGMEPCWRGTNGRGYRRRATPEWGLPGETPEREGEYTGGEAVSRSVGQSVGVIASCDDSHA